MSLLSDSWIFPPHLLRKQGLGKGRLYPLGAVRSLRAGLYVLPHCSSPRLGSLCIVDLQLLFAESMPEFLTSSRTILRGSGPAY